MVVPSGDIQLRSRKRTDGAIRCAASRVHARFHTRFKPFGVLEADPLLDTDDRTRRIAALSAEGRDVAALIAQLQGDVDLRSGGWGLTPLYAADPLDTALALAAVAPGSALDDAALVPALSFLLASQGADGGWSCVSGGESDVFCTAYALLALAPYRVRFLLDPAIPRGVAFLKAQLNARGSFGVPSPRELIDAAAASLALSAVSAVSTEIPAVVDFLTLNQQDDGSWDADPYTTALVLEALFALAHVPVCGDGAANAAGETCDGADLRGATCSGLGLGTGAVACTPACTLDVTGCSSPARCGDGIANQSVEACDASDLRGQSCPALGLGPGTLACTSACTFDTVGCSAPPRCGDGIVNQLTEACDGADLAGKTCRDVGFVSGTLACNAGCTFDASACTGTPFCGDGAINQSSEECDGADLAGKSCQSLGLGGGTLACRYTCELQTAGCDFASTDRISIGTPSTVTLRSPDKAALLLFDGTQGQYLSLYLSSGVFRTRIVIYQPGGDYFFYGSFGSGSAKLDLNQLPVSGTYIIEIQSESPTSIGSLTLQILQDAAGALVVDEPPVTMALVAGQNGRYTMAGNAGDYLRLSVTSLAMSGTGFVDLHLYSPDGTTLWNGNSSAPASWQLPLLPISGTYTLRVIPEDARGVTGATLAVKLTGSLPDSLPTDGSAVQFQTTGQPGRFTFTGTAGQGWTMHATAGSTFTSSIGLSAYRPNGARYTGTTLSRDSDVKLDLGLLPETGTYTVIIEPNGVDTGTVTLLLVAEATGTLTVGGAASNILLGTAQNGRFTFMGNSGDYLGLAVSSLVTNPSGGSASLEIYGPDGRYLVSTYSSSSAPESWQLPQVASSDTYTLRVIPEGTLGATLAVNLTGSFVARPTFTAPVAGQTVNLPSTASGNCDAFLFGRATVDSISGAYSSGYKYVDQFVLGKDGVVDALYTYIAGASYPVVVGKAFVYADNGGAPGGLLGVSQEVVGVVGASWVRFPLAAPLSLSAGSYWIGVEFSGASPDTMVTASGGHIERNLNTYSSGPSNPFGPPSNTWTNGMDIYMATPSATQVTVYADGTIIGTVSCANGSWSTTLSGLSNGVHTLTATATNANGNTSAESAGTTFTVGDRPDAPGAPTFSNVGPQTVTVSWTASPSAASYKVERGTGGSFTEIAAGVTSLSFIDNGVTANVDYYYRVRATNAMGFDGGYSSTASVSTPVEGVARLSITAPLAGQTVNLPSTVSGTCDKFLFGRATVDGISGAYSGGYKYVDQFVLGKAGVVDALYTYIAGASYPVVVGKAFVYADNGGAPGGLLGVSQEVVGVVGNTWVRFPFAAPLSLSAGSYWIGVEFSGASPGTMITASGGHIEANLNTYSSGPSNPFGAPSKTWANGMDIYMATPSATQVTVYADGTAIGTVSCANGSWSTTLSGLSYGVHTLTATATDADGNTSAESAGITFTVGDGPDAPGPPTFTAPLAGQTVNLPSTASGICDAFLFGRATVDSISGAYSSGYKYVDQFVLGKNGVVDALYTYIAGANYPVVVGKAFVYADNGGAPGELLGVSQEVVGVVGNSWVRFPFAAPLSLSAGSYWIGVEFSGASPGTMITASGGHIERNVNTYSSGLSNPFGLPSDTWTYGMDIYMATPSATQVTVYADGTAIETVSCANGSWSTTLSGLSYGVHTLTATATDANGNTSAACAGITFTVGGGS